MRKVHKIPQREKDGKAADGKIQEQGTSTYFLGIRYQASSSDILNLSPRYIGLATKEPILKFIPLVIFLARQPSILLLKSLFSLLSLSLSLSLHFSFYLFKYVTAYKFEETLLSISGPLRPSFLYQLLMHIYVYMWSLLSMLAFPRCRTVRPGSVSGYWPSRSARSPHWRTYYYLYVYLCWMKTLTKTKRIQLIKKYPRNLFLAAWKIQSNNFTFVLFHDTDTIDQCPRISPLSLRILSIEHGNFAPFWNSLRLLICTNRSVSMHELRHTILYHFDNGLFSPWAGLWARFTKSFSASIHEDRATGEWNLQKIDRRVLQ